MEHRLNPTWSPARWLLPSTAAFLFGACSGGSHSAEVVAEVEGSDSREVAGDVGGIDSADVVEDAGLQLPFAPAGPEAAPDPMLPGPFPVGVLTMDFEDSTRLDPETGEPRFLRTEVWYPASAIARGMAPWAWDLKTEADDRVDLGDARDAFMEANMPSFPSSAIRDAPPELRFGPYPVVLFSHGSYGLRFQYTFITEHLASHGFIVAAVDHPGSMFWDLVRSGPDTGTLIQSGIKRPGDLSFVLDRLEEAGRTKGGPLEGMVDPTLVAAVGHSLGGSTAVSVPCLDSRFDAVVLLAPVIPIAQSFGLAYEEYPVPVLTLGGTLDLIVEWTGLWCEHRRLDSPEKLLVEIVGAGHFTFSDLCALDWDAATKLEFLVEPANVQDDGCNPENNIPVSEAHSLIKHYATAYLNGHLRGSPGSLERLAEEPLSPFDHAHLHPGDLSGDDCTN